MSISTEKLNNETWFKISDFNSIRPFFMSVVSDSNHWMFISSNGGLSAGRKNSQFALFPYYTDDKITELSHTTGSKTILQVEVDNKVHVWEPFSERFAEHYSISQNLYKNKLGNKIMFEEINHDFGLSFRYEWNSSNMYGFVRKSSLHNSSDKPLKISIIDGIQNIMPYGVSPDLQVRASNLVDAYKRSELIEDSGVGVFALSAIIVDKAEPSEALKANVAWSLGLENPSYLLSSLQLENFRNLESVHPETDVKGEKGAYFLHTELNLEAAGEKKWMIVANVNLTHSAIIALNEMIISESNVAETVLEDVEQGSIKLTRLVGGADGLQKTADKFKDTRHYSNTLFNIMRGGTFDDNYKIEKKDFTTYLKHASNVVAERNQAFVNNLKEEFDKFELNALLEETDDPDLLRLAKEYLPLKFSRRHGDPSRPWNQFSINTNSEIDGSKILDYEGNWRDIFQNWEALVHSYPDFLEGMIFKFLNATTFDGYNPYRVTKGGFDWETIEPDDPWSYIGYWGDHQIIYLLKFLEFYQQYKPKGLEALFNQDVFVYANVPYKIKSYSDIVSNPKDTIEFDEPLDHAIRAQVEKIGADGALLTTKTNSLHHVSFMEKILATVLSKVSNFIPEGGIWMNTQRPEWNDANNALVGNGVSMVTLYYLRRFLKFFDTVLDTSENSDITVSVEVKEFFSEILEVLTNHKEALSSEIDDVLRKHITDGLGLTGSRFRDRIYGEGFSGEKSTLNMKEVASFITTALSYMEHSIRANRREDNLFHAYNLLSFEGEKLTLSYLDEMLEGQVSALSSGYLSSEESLQLLDALKESTLYRKDQQSYILYPNKDLPKFMEKNSIPKEAVEKSELLKKLVEDYNLQIIIKNVKGGYHFNGNFKNAGDLKLALEELKSTSFASLVEKEESYVLDVFESVFNHKAFTGRSGTFFAFEGLGSIYWHMVSKLHLATFEVCQNEFLTSKDKPLLSPLAHHFDLIGKGIGIHKSPELYGAFPTDPYSHTPQHRGAQQPGMTGQVKEDILVRFGELGVFMENEQLHFQPFLLRKDEFKSTPSVFKYTAINGERKEVQMPSGSLAFTYCQVPIIYIMAEKDEIHVSFEDGSSSVIEALTLDTEISTRVFKRTGTVQKLVVYLSENHLRTS